MAPVILELGGNDPAILAPDVEIDENLAGTLAAAAFLTTGQVCMAIKRLYVPEARLGEVLDALVTECEATVVGDGLADDTTMGPLHTAAARDRVEAMLAEAESAGAKVHRCGTVRSEDADAGGHVMRPAIVAGAPPDGALVREEQFGPALPVLTYRDLDDAVAQANDTDYGLCASVWTGDDDLASKVAHRLEAGTVWINNHGMFAVDVQAPFGGWKCSGVGRELGPDGLLAFTRTRTITNRTM
jgi:acyl-CoA reductase-like NAD-dependent aldehyde dehydrogenase